MRWWKAAALVAAIAWAVPAAAAGRITMDELRAGLDAGRVVLVDVREPDEFSAGHVPGAVNVPVSRMSLAALPPAGDKTVVVMCRSGNRSSRVQAAAAQAGRADLVDYAGSMNEWTAKGGPIVKGP